MSLGKKLEPDVLTHYFYSSDTANSKGIQIGFYGTSCLSVTYKGETYLNDPFFSNPGYAQLITGNYPDRSELIRPYIQNFGKTNLVTITHGHYDHCLDLPSFKDTYHNETKFISSASTLYSLSEWLNENTHWKKIKIDHPEFESQWIYSEDRHFRVFPIPSHHHPHIGKHIKFSSGQYDTPLDKVPGPVWQWQEGGTYSFFVDVLNQDEIISRFLIASGDVPKESAELISAISKARNIDILFAQYWHKKKCYPTLEKMYEELKPKQIILLHWNNFFRSTDKPLQMIRSSDIESEIKKLKSQGLPVSVLMPFSDIII